MENSEIFNLHVRAWKGAITDLLSTNEIQHICKVYGDGEIPQEQLAESVILTNRDQVWFLFESWRWGRWFNGLSLAGEEDGYEFPIVGEIKPEYNVRGCAAITRCIKEVESVALESTSDVVWAAGAKPFGTVENFEGETDVVTALKSFVVPCFTNVRLVPLDSVGGEDLATADYGWVTHVRKHLPFYLEHGPMNAQGCFYCLQLQTWEKKYFRDGGIRWLKYYAGTCIRGTGGGGSPGQAFMELALGMLALALVLSALFGFTAYILSSLRMQRDIRAEAGRGALNSGGGEESYSSKIADDTVEVEPLAATYIFGSSEVEVKEEVHIPSMSGLDQ